MSEETATRGVRQRVKAEPARAEILTAAARRMRRVGYSEMSLRDLAAEVNMKAGSLYYHFASKDELATEVMRNGAEAIEAVGPSGLAAAPDRTPDQRLLTGVRLRGGQGDTACEVRLTAGARMMRRGVDTEMGLTGLAAEVNRKAGRLSDHFDSEGELGTEVMRIGVEAIAAVGRRGLDDATDRSPAERLSIAVRVHLETLLEKSDFVSSHIRCYPFVPEAVREQLRDVRRSYDQVIGRAHD